MSFVSKAGHHLGDSIHRLVMKVDIAELFRAEGDDDENAMVYEQAKKKHL